MGSDKLVLFSFQNEAASPAVTLEVPAPSMEMEAPEPVERRVNSRANPVYVADKPANSKNGVSKMDVMKMLAELRQEREHIEEAILTLERLARGRGKRRGRPPAWMKTEVKKRGRPPGSKNKAKDSSPN
jgi:hypothetical protein